MQHEVVVAKMFMMKHLIGMIKAILLCQHVLTGQPFSTAHLLDKACQFSIVPRISLMIIIVCYDSL